MISNFWITLLKLKPSNLKSAKLRLSSLKSAKLKLPSLKSSSLKPPSLKPLSGDLLFACFLSVILIGCGSDAQSGSLKVTSDFESGSIGAVKKVGVRHFHLSLKDDNDDDELPDNFRNWYYFKLENVDTSQKLTLTINNRGWNYFYAPVYSYDKKTWFRFDKGEVTQKRASYLCNNPVTQRKLRDECSLTIKKTFSHSKVYIARFYPYTHTDLVNYLKTIENHECVNITSLGKSPETKKSIPLITIRCPDSQASQVVWMHARTHSAEIGPSFLLEGAIKQLLSDIDNDLNNSRDVEFYIVPMHNIDGVIFGNYRTNADSINLENNWFYDSESLPNLTDEAPLENKLVLSAMNEINTKYADQELIALNLHSSNSTPGQKTFAFPHFGDDPDLYTEKEINLWNKSNDLLHLINTHYHYLFDTNASGGAFFLTRFYPETWWWEQRKDEVLAMTIETTYGTAGYEPFWITPDDLRDLGKSLTLAIYDYRDDL